VEASLLPSREFVDLCHRVPVAAVRRAASADLRREFRLPYASVAWIVVLDARGETLAAFTADAAGGCTKEDAAELPAKLAAMIDARLKRTESLQDLERRGAFWERVERLHEASDGPRLAEAFATLKADEPRRAELFNKVVEHWMSIDDPERLAAMRREGVELLAKTDAVADSLERAFVLSFDAAAKCAAAVARLHELGAGRRAAKLSAAVLKVVASYRTVLKRDGYFAAVLGDAAGAARLADSPTPLYRAWAAEARARLRR